MQATLQLTIGDIVAHDLRTASVFARHGIDFCCGGRTPLDEACRARGLDPAVVLSELDAVEREATAAADVTTWSPDAIIDRIVTRHHSYVRLESEVIRSYLSKLVGRHGANHPELIRLASIFDAVSGELRRHMDKEEAILFPYIRALAAAERGERPAPPSPFGTVRNPIRMMEEEHQDAAGALSSARVLTADYAPPADACQTYKACYASLDAFERDLHEHVHLENNVLFPMAEAIEDRLRR